MDDSNAQVVVRVALNKGMPSFSVLIFIITLSVSAFAFLIVALVLIPKITVVFLGCVIILFAWWWYWNGSRGPFDWERVAFLEHRDGKITFVPDRRMRSMGYTVAEAPFPVGSRLEYHIETGDRYFTGDHAQVLSRSFRAIEPTGIKHQLLDSAAYLNLTITTTSLQSAGIPFQVVKTYDGQEGEHTEADVTEDYIRASKKVWNRGPVAILIGTSSLWLGALAGVFVQNTGYLIAIGLFGYAAIAILSLRSSFFRKRTATALIQLLAVIPSYAAGYAAVVLIIRHSSSR